MTKLEKMLSNKNTEDIENYAQSVLSSSIPVGKFEVLAVERYKRDLLNPDYYFDWDAVQNLLNFIQLQCKHSKGSLAGKNIKLEPWQKFILANIYGFKKTGNNRRKYRKVLIEVARKNGKTSLLSAVALYHLLELDGEAGNEIYSISTKREQSKISWEISKSMVNQNDFLSNKIIVSQNRLSYKNSYFSPLASEDKSSDGLNPSLTICDEIHAYQTSAMVDVMSSGMGARENPLLFQITTAGFDVNNYGYQEHQYAEKILEGAISDENYFAVIFALDEDDDYMDKALWRKANPNLDVSVYPEFLEGAMAEAQGSPAKLNNFKTKNLNLWSNSASRWIDYNVWNKNTDVFDISSLKGQVCYGGIDLSTNLDLTAVALNFPPQKEGDKHRKLYHFWLPDENIVEKEREDKVPYRAWADKGYLTLTPGAVIDYTFVAERIKTYVKDYNLRMISADRWRLLDLVRLMPEYEDLFIEFSQGIRSMSPASLEYERLIKQGQMETNQNPVINWMIMNTEIKFDANTNIKIVKPQRDKTGKRIDGVIADVMATFTSIEQEQNRPKCKPEDMVFFF